ncbi:TPA: hypothetical protein TXL52_001867 [Streptococcus suis]|nr:hypothetical protein [Streptococcus suis]
MASEKMKRAIILAVFTDKTQKEIAKEVGVGETRIPKWKKTDEYKKIKEEVEREYFGDLAAPAIRKLHKLLEAKSELVAFQTATYILDRSGYKPTDKQEIEHSGTVVFANEADIPD